MVVFDLFVLNTDRHAANLAFLPSQKRLDVFDHSHALLGARQGRVQQRLMRDGWVPARLPISHPSSGRSQTRFHIRSIPQALLRLRKQIVRRLVASFGL